MKHHIDRRTANHFWSNHYFWRCTRCGTWVSPDYMLKGGEMNKCGGKTERQHMERIHGKLEELFKDVNWRKQQ